MLSTVTEVITCVAGARKGKEEVKSGKKEECYTIKIDSFRSKSFNVVFIEFGPYSGYFNH